MTSKLTTMAMAIVAAVSGLALATSAHAITFASYTFVAGTAGPKPTITWACGCSAPPKPGGTASAQNLTGKAYNIKFSFGDPVFSNANGGNPLLALLTLSGTSAMPVAMGTANQYGIGTAQFPGTFSIIYQGPMFVFSGKTFKPGVTDLLSGTFVNGEIATNLGASSGSFLADSNALGAVTFTSDILKFAPTGAKDFSLALTGITPVIKVAANGSLSGFSAVSAGLFDAKLAAPEPASWALMLLGVAGVGGMTRRRRAAAATA